MNDCLASTGISLPPVLFIVVLLLIGGVIALVVGRRSVRGAGVAVMALALALGFSGVASPAPAFAASCPPSPAATAAPVAQGSISGTYTIDGSSIVVTSPPGYYETNPGDGWNLPTFEPLTGAAVGVVVTLRLAGADGVLDTADDTLSTSETNAAGYYEFTGLANGAYRVTAAAPSPDYEFSSSTGWGWATCTTSYLASPLAITTPASAAHEATIADADALTGLDFVATNNANSAAACG